ncbi:hypothetical protein I7I50_04655 [Histoplasma capsulatum G186AR]|uniref:Uncharacterized protein n=1 Tax=Ajellomyces capsulatus TaxID=5037 RepID=A0A8H7YMS0_AJECA|nr:hypothetical protein I7I52_05564 [Histoplasma capsulatum]QSS75503.1 hypothetical protein I7I50_04655 [Histoplasma capsulatum G186AR]
MALILPDIRTCLVLSESRPVFSRKSSCLCRNHFNEENLDFHSRLFIYNQLSNLQPTKGRSKRMILFLLPSPLTLNPQGTTNIPVS